MPLAKDVATELRKLADALDLHPEVDIRQGHLSFHYGFATDKDQFLATARILPHPLKKNYPINTDRFSRVSVDHETPALHVSASIYREAVCNLVTPAQPAVYDCELTLSESEDAELEVA